MEGLGTKSDGRSIEVGDAKRRCVENLGVMPSSWANSMP